MTIEQAVMIPCSSDTLVGILHRGHDSERHVGILVVVGGPQYRVGSHRQFVLMARRWAAAGYPVLRFDYRGMGDSSGEPRTFESVDEDIRAAIDAFMAEVPSLNGVVLFGLCDAASASLLYCRSDARLRGLILANPWVRTPEGEARSYIRHYYGSRLLQRSFWEKLVSGKMGVMKALRNFVGSWSLSRRVGAIAAIRHESGFVERMQLGLASFPGQVLILISDNDLVAKEFTDLCRGSNAWSKTIARAGVSVRVLPGADHTFSARRTIEDAVAATLAWLAPENAHSSSVPERIRRP